jgi:hypothetical protein
MRIILVLQAVYYLLTGLWPIVSLSTFEELTGPKTDDWLVRMVGLLAAAIGATLMLGIVAGKPKRETICLAVLSALSFAAIDTVYSLNGTISRVYLVDAGIQAMLIAALTVARLRGRRAG